VYLGIDIGTSGVKTVLVDDAQALVDQQTQPLLLQRPHALWSEQDPEAWWAATVTSLDALAARRKLAGVRAIGLTGQMHGLVLLDAGERVLRPAILWNDGRSHAECAELERRAPRLRAIAGNAAMPGFTAPKLLWVAAHEPEVFRRIAKVLLPKDYVRLRLTGELASDVSDASGTLWLDVAARAWSPELLAASQVSAAQLPRLVEGTEPAGQLRAQLASRFGIARAAIVAGGAGDQAGGAAGVGVIQAGQALLSLGTSGVIFVARATPTADPERGVHTFCHCVPGTWHQMSVILSAASCLHWAAAALGAADEAALLLEIEAAAPRPARAIFLPYLSGERTPHNDPSAMGVFFGLTHDTTRAELGRAVLEGVAFALADGAEALDRAGAQIESLWTIGGGARSLLWLRILASVLDRSLLVGAGAELGPAFGAARLARLAETGEPPAAVCTPPAGGREVGPDAALRDAYSEQRQVFQGLYSALRGSFAAARARTTFGREAGTSMR